MADSTILGGVRTVNAGLDLATVNGTSIVSSATSNTKGAYVELISAANNTEESSFIELVIATNAQTNNLYLIDIAIGEAGSEIDILENVAAMTHLATSGSANVTSFRLPKYIPAGVRISARCQANGISLTVKLMVNLGLFNSERTSPPHKITSYGVNLGTSRGVEVATTTAGTFGSWVEISASTTEMIKALAISASRNPSNWSTGRIAFQVGVGSAGNEVVVIDGAMLATSSTEKAFHYLNGAYDVTIPEGSRLAIRAASSGTNTDFNFSYIIHGVS